MASEPVVLPLSSMVEVVAFSAFSAITWFNCGELLWTIFVKFQRWKGRYFYCLVIATCGVFLYTLDVFFMIFATHFKMRGVVLGISIGWSAMVTGQSLVLWSRLHLVCRSPWKLRAILWMIIIDGVSMHIPQLVFAQFAIKNNAVDPTYKPFEVMEKISIAIFTVQELIISLVYLYETVRILRVGEMVQKKGNRRRIQMLFLANIAIISVDVITVTLEFLAFWGVWCSFKGFGYSVKLKIEFAILGQLRDSVKTTGGSSGYGQSDNGISLSSRPRKSMKPSSSALGRQTFKELEENDHITKTTEISVHHTEHGDSHKSKVLPIHDKQPTTTKMNRLSMRNNTPSEASSEIEFATKGYP